MDDVKCPYCNKDQEINHDDGYGYAEDRLYEQECWSCEKTFVYETTISFYYDATKADCLNGAEHPFKKVMSHPNPYPDHVRCPECGKEERGTYHPEIMDKYFEDIKKKEVKDGT